MCKSIGFVSPKAQILQQKVQDMHKSWDTFNTTSDALTKEGVKLFVEHAEDNETEANAENFETWLEKDVKNQNWLTTGVDLVQTTDGNSIISHHIMDVNFVDGKIKELNAFDRASEKK